MDAAARFGKALGAPLGATLGLADAQDPDTRADALLGKELRLNRGAVIPDELIAEGACVHACAKHAKQAAQFCWMRAKSEWQ